MKRRICLLVIPALLLLMCCGAAQADGLRGSGTAASPFLIENAEQWDTFASDVNSGINGDKYYKLTADVGVVSATVGTEDHPFTGNFDGGGKTLTVNMVPKSITEWPVDYRAPFRFVSGAAIHDLSVAGYIDGYRHSAGLVGHVLGGDNTIARCTVSTDILGRENAGGIVGYNSDTAAITMTDCLFNGKIQCYFGNFMGGLLGCSTGGTLTISSCLCSGEFTGDIGSFYPIACKPSENTVTANVTDAYYFTEPVNWSDDTRVAAAGWRAYSSQPEGIISKEMTVRGITFYGDMGAALPGLKSTYPYTGQQIAADLWVTIGGRIAEEGTDYSIVVTRDGAPVSAVRDKGEYEVIVVPEDRETCLGMLRQTFYVFAFDRGSDGSYLLKDEVDWRAFALDVNSGTDYSGKTVRMADNIYGADETAGTSEHPFRGVFDGNGKLLSVNIRKTAEDTVAPFRRVDGARIKNLTVAGTVMGGNSAAGLVGVPEGSGCVIENCFVRAKVTSTSGLVNTQVGGIVCWTVNPLAIRNSAFTGTLGNAVKIGGLVSDCGGEADVTLENALFAGKAEGYSNFHPVSCKDKQGSVTSSVDRVYYTMEGVITNTNVGFIEGGKLVYETAVDNTIYGAVICADGRTYYRPASVSGYSRWYTYNGEEIGIAPEAASADGDPLTPGADYTFTVSPSVVRDRGEYTLTVSGKGSYAGVMTDTLTVDDAIVIASGTTTWEDGKVYRVAGNVSTRNEFVVQGDVTLILSEGSHLETNSGIRVYAGSKLTIEGTGELRAVAPGAAGIGGDNDHDTGTIVINGGSVSAVGGIISAGGAGIGGGSGHSGGTVVINGGTVWAEGYGGAGIGGGIQGSGGSITINGGYVSAKGYGLGAGIGGGANYALGSYGGGGSITINGGVVEAYADGSGAGIGGGGAKATSTNNILGGSGGGVTIKGGTVRASSRNGYSIGPGIREGATIYASDKNSGAPGSLTLSWTNAADSILANRVSAGTCAIEKPMCYSQEGWIVDDVAAGDLQNKDNEYLIVPKTDAPLLPGAGTKEDPYRIESTQDWNELAQFVQGGGTTQGKYYLLASDITVSSMIGVQGKRFSGTFDGGENGSILTFNAENTDDNPVAPFAYTSGVTIRNLRVTGSITGSGTHASGLIGENAGKSTVTNCRISAEISGSQLIGGFCVGPGNSTFEITGCVFDGKIMGEPDQSGCFAAWGTNGLSIADSMAAPKNGSAFSGGVFCYAGDDRAPTLTNCYSIQSPGVAQGKQAYSVTTDEDMTLDFGTPRAVYPASGVTAYARGLAYGGVFRAGEEETVALNVTSDAPVASLLASTGILTRLDGEWNLTLSAADVSIRSIPAFGTAAFVLPTGLIAIGESAFRDMASMTSVDARNCTSIGSQAFKGCIALTKIRLPANCDIAPDAFEGCRTVYVYAPAGGDTANFCRSHNNCIFAEEEQN